MKWHGTLAMAGGFVSHLLIAGNLYFQPGVSLQEALVLGSGILVILVGFLEFFTRETFFSIFVLPLCIIFLCFSPLADTISGSEHLRGGVFVTHVLASITGECFFLLATITGAAYLVVVRKLKQKNRLRAMYFFPPLARLDSLMVWFMALGLIFFGGGIFLGSIWAHQSFGSINFFSPKRLLSVITILFFSSTLIARNRGAAAGNRLAMLSMFGLLLSLSVVFAPDTQHRWISSEATSTIGVETGLPQTSSGSSRGGGS